MNATAPPDDPVIHYYDSDYPSATHNPYPEEVTGFQGVRFHPGPAAAAE
jgi:hypothetical protein